MVCFGGAKGRRVARVAVGIVALALVAGRALPRDDERPNTNASQGAKETGAIQADAQLPARVIVLNAEQIEREAARDAREIRDQSPVDVWARLGIAGTLLIGVMQLAVFSYQAWKLRQTVSEGRDAIKAASDAANAAGAQARTAELAFLTFHRPRIRVRSITQTEMDTGGRWGLYINIVNVGDTPATVTEINIYQSITYRTTQKNEIFFDEVPGNPRELDFEVYMKRGDRRAIPSEIRFHLKPGSLDKARDVRNQLRINGSIIYLDGKSDRHETGFEWVWNQLEGRFEPNPDPQRSYED